MSEFRLKNKAATKLTVTQVQEIRQFYSRGAVSQGQLARDYQVSVVTIGRIVRGETWQGAGLSMPTEEELKASAQRMLALQETSGMEKLQQVAREAGETKALAEGIVKEIEEADPGIALAKKKGYL